MTPRPRVLLFGRANALSLSLVEKLLGNFCSVSIITDDLDIWEKKTSHISQREFLAIDSRVPETGEYSLLVDLVLNLPRHLYETFFSFYRKENPKSLIILPYSGAADVKRKIDEIVMTAKNVGGNIGIVFVGDLIGARVEVGSSPLVELIKEAAEKKSIWLSEDREEYFPVSPGFLAKEIVRSLFSFGPYGGTLVLIGPKVSDIELGQRLQRFIEDCQIKYRKGKREIFAKAVEKEEEEANLDMLIKETLEWDRSHPEKSVSIPKIEKPKEGKIHKERGPKRKFWGLLFLLFLVLFLPYLFLLSSLGLIFVSAKTAPSFKFDTTTFVLSLARGSSYLSFGQLSLYGKTPFLGAAFISSSETAKLLYNISDAGLDALSAGKRLFSLSNKILGDEVYDISQEASEISLDIDSLYQETSFIQSELENLGGLRQRLFKVLFKNKDFSLVRESALEVKRIVDELPELLGKDSFKRYLVLFQNNMELRPTGGFIGSFAVLNFNGGRLTDVNVMDVYSADGQLKGHVEPPIPIRQHLGEANWYLRDSNWDPDFPLSASRAEWFLDKEIDTKVDGVVALDLEFVKKILTVTGPIALNDFSEVVNAQNLYEVTQRRVEEDFFPGSYQKSSFLTAISRELIRTLSEPNEKNLLGFLRVGLSSLQEKHIQLFFHNRRVQNSISNLGFDGAVKEPTCGGNCYADWYGLVDSNMGVNKANYFIDRSQSFQVFFSEGQLKRFLTVLFENKASPALGLTGRYKSYLRVLVPQEAEAKAVLVSFANETQEVTPDVTEVRGRKEIGVSVEVSAGQRKSVTFSWEEVIPLTFSQAGEYRLYIRKQAGTKGDSISVNLSLPSSFRPAFEPSFFLTNQGSYVYNTTLTRDFFSRISWQNGQTSFRSRD